MKHHPDRNAGDPRAAERFKRIVRAYRAALYGERPTRSAPPPPPPRPERYSCGSCGDSFPFPERCPRCGVELCDGVARHADDPRVDAFVRALEGRPPPKERHPSELLPVPGLLAALSLGMAALVWSIGPGGLALLFVGFACYVVLLEASRLLRPLA
jgi:hypothetical protein